MTFPRVQPIAPTWRKDPFDHPEWVFDVKYDGFHLHWIDASSGELLDLLIEKIEGWPVLLIATFRPDFQPRWTGQPQVTTLSLTRLNRQHSAELVARIAGPAGALPSDLAAEIVERCDGVPLFLEELTKATIEQAAAPERARSLVGAVPGPGAVPATLQASLMARLDRLGAPARELVLRDAKALLEAL